MNTTYKDRYIELVKVVMEAGFRIVPKTGIEIVKQESTQTLPKLQKTKKPIGELTYAQSVKNDTFYCVQCSTKLKGSREKGQHLNSTGHTPLINATRLLNRRNEGSGGIATIAGLTGMSVSEVQALTDRLVQIMDASGEQETQEAGNAHIM